MKVRSLTEKLIAYIITTPARRRFRIQMERKVSVLLEAIKSVESNLQRAQELKLKDHEVFANGVLFALVLQLDLSILLFDQASELDEPRKNLYSRQLALLLHEGFDDLPAVFGKDFRAALQILPCGKTVLHNLGLEIRKITTLGAVHLNDLKEIRRLAAAHRTHRVFEQLTVIRNLDHKSLTNIAADLDQHLAKLANILTPAMLEFGKPEIIFRQWR